MHPAMWRTACLGLMFGALTQVPAWAQKPTPADTKELVAVLEFDGVNASKSQVAATTEELRAQLLHSGRYRVVDRQQIDTLLKEQAFQQTGCTSQECAVQVGKMLGVRKIVTGRITKIDEALWQASAQMVDVESGETLRAETVNQHGAFDALLGEGLTALAGKLTGSAATITSSATAAAEGSSDMDFLKNLGSSLSKMAAVREAFDGDCGKAAGMRRNEIPFLRRMGFVFLQIEKQLISPEAAGLTEEEGKRIGTAMERLDRADKNMSVVCAKDAEYSAALQQLEELSGPTPNAGPAQAAIKAAHDARVDAANPDMKAADDSLTAAKAEIDKQNRKFSILRDYKAAVGMLATAQSSAEKALNDKKAADEAAVKAKKGSR